MVRPHKRIFLWGALFFFKFPNSNSKLTGSAKKDDVDSDDQFAVTQVKCMQQIYQTVLLAYLG